MTVLTASLLPVRASVSVSSICDAAARLRLGPLLLVSSRPGVPDSRAAELRAEVPDPDRRREHRAPGAGRRPGPEARGRELVHRAKKCERMPYMRYIVSRRLCLYCFHVVLEYVVTSCVCVTTSLCVGSLRCYFRCV